MRQQSDSRELPVDHGKTVNVASRKSHIQAFFTCVNSNFKCINRLCCRVSVCVRVCVSLSVMNVGWPGNNVARWSP